MKITHDNLPTAMAALFERFDRLEGTVNVLAAQSKEVATDTGKPLNVKEAATLLDLAPQTIYGMTHRREIPHFRKRGRLYFDRVSLLAWLAEGRREHPDKVAQAVLENVGTKKAAQP